MRKLLFLVFVALISGCTTAGRLNIDGDRHFRIIQVLDDGALAMRCDKLIGDTGCVGMVVYLPNTTGELMYEEKILFLDSPQIIDTFTYTTVEERVKTVPVIVNKERSE